MALFVVVMVGLLLIAVGLIVFFAATPEQTADIDVGGRLRG